MMEIKEMIDPKLILFDERINTKEELFDQAARLFNSVGIVENIKKYKKDLFIRENQISTGIEDSFGIPHAKSQAVTRPAIAFIKSGPISDYKAMDGTTVEYSFLIAAPTKGSDEHLIILSSLARLLMHEEFRNKLKEAVTPKDIIDIIKTNY